MLSVDIAMVPTMVLVTEVPTLLPMMTGMPSLSVIAPLAAIATTIEVVAEEDCQRYIFNGAEAETVTRFFNASRNMFYQNTKHNLLKRRQPNFR